MSERKSSVDVIMGSGSDLPVMQEAPRVLDEFGVPYNLGIKSAHRTPDMMRDYAKYVSSRGVKVVIAGAGGSAHLPGMVAAYTRLPVIGVPVERHNPQRDSSLKSMLDMPYGEPVLTVGINKADNAALAAIRILAISDPELAEKLEEFHRKHAEKVRADDRELAKDGLYAFQTRRNLEA